MPPAHVVYHEVLITNKQYMRDCTPIDMGWLVELAPQYYSYKNKKLNAQPVSERGDYEEGTHKRRKIGPAMERLQ